MTEIAAAELALTGILIDNRTPEQWAHVIKADLGQAVAGFIAAGQHLSQAKEQLGLAGYEWEQWLRDEIGIRSAPIASMLMAIGAYGPMQDHKYIYDLPRQYPVLYELTQLAESDFTQSVDAKIVDPDLDRDDAKLIRAAYEVPETHRNWLPPAEMVRAYRDNPREAVSPKMAATLASAADKVLADIEADEAATEDDRLAFIEWLVTNSGTESWSYRSLGTYHANLVREFQSRRDEALKPVIACAPWEDWLPAQDHCDLLLTDPPYSTDVADIEAFARTWLPVALGKVKSTGRAYVCVGAYPDELAAYLAVKPPSHLTLSQVLVWTYRNTLGPSASLDYNLNWQAILYYRGTDAPPLDCPEMNEQFAVQDITAPDGRHGNRFYEWQKPDELAERLIRHSTSPGALILDPFAGSGTFVLAATRLGRRGLGCEVSDRALRIARERGCASES